MNPHIVLTTFGSLGDLHPYLAVGLELRRRGARVTVATSEIYRENVSRAGLEFYAVRPDLRGLVDHPETVARALHPRTGGSYILKQMMLPHLEQSLEDLLPLAREADLLVSHAIAFATPIAADLLGKPWVSVILQPAALLSAYDPPTAAAVPFLERFRGMGPAFWRPLIKLGRAAVARAGAPVNQVRAQVGVARVENPIFDGMFSPHSKHAWFPGALAKPQPDWPADLHICGYPFYDEAGQGMAPDLAEFLDRGAPPVVFTMGSAAVFDAGSFYRDSAQAAERMGVRAVLLTGRDPRNRPARALPPTIVSAEYAPYGELFARAAAVVHQGGIGTTSQALRAGKPMLVLPHCHDQPDNARRVRELGVARVMRRAKYNATTAAEAIGDLLVNPVYSAAAERVAVAVHAEKGASAAAELLLNRPGIQ